MIKLHHIAAILLGTCTASQAAIIVWGSATNITTSSSDVSTLGTSFIAYNIGSTTDYTINGVFFDGITSGFSNSGTAYNGYGSLAGSDADYGAALSTGMYFTGNNQPAENMTISGLEIGQEYQIQAWFNDQRDLAATGTTTLSSAGGNSVGLVSSTPGGQYALGTFTANATTQVFTIHGANTGATLNMFQVRNITAVPEPSAALLGGLGLLALLRRRR